MLLPRQKQAVLRRHDSRQFLSNLCMHFTLRVGRNYVARAPPFGMNLHKLCTRMVVVVDYKVATMMAAQLASKTSENPADSNRLKCALGSGLACMQRHGNERRAAKHHVDADK